MRNEHPEPLREIARLYLRQQREAVACGGTSLTECWIVTDLGRSGDRTLTELARSIGFDKSWTSRAVEALAAEGLVAKETDGADARRLRISLTAAGRKRFEAMNSRLEDHARQVMNRIPRAKRAAVKQALALVHEALRAHADAGLKEVACGS